MIYVWYICDVACDVDVIVIVMMWWRDGGCDDDASWGESDSLPVLSRSQVFMNINTTSRCPLPQLSFKVIAIIIIVIK